MRPARPVLVPALCLVASVPAAGQATLNPGICYRIPFLDTPAAQLARLDDPLLPEIAISPDGDRVIDPRRMRIYDAATGAVDAAFSPDGTELVLDWALGRGGQYGNVLMRLSIAARQLRVLTDPIPASPDFTSHNDDSQLNPLWK